MKIKIEVIKMEKKTYDVKIRWDRLPAESNVRIQAINEKQAMVYAFLGIAQGHFKNMVEVKECKN